MNWKDVFREFGLKSEEQDTFELKEAATSLPESIWKSIMGFSNSTGGTIVLGVNKEKTITGVYDADRVQADISSALANTLSMGVNLEYEILTVGEKMIVAVKVMEAAAHAKPIHFKNQGPYKGALKRFGSVNVPIDADDALKFYADKGGESPDSQIIEGLTIEDLSAETIEIYRRLISRTQLGRKASLRDDAGLLKSIGAMKYNSRSKTWGLSKAALLLFGQEDIIRSQFPAFEIQITRFIDGNPTAEYRGEKIVIEGKSLIEMMLEIEDHLNELYPTQMRVKPGKLAREENQIFVALREAVINAVVHQDYLAHRHIQVRIYGDRLEIENAGYSKKPTEQKREEGSFPRNPILARGFELAGWVEKQGLGWATIIEVITGAGFSEPEFSDDRVANKFNLKFLWHHFINSKDAVWISRFEDLSEHEKRILLACRRDGRVENKDVRKMCNIDTNKASNLLQRLAKKKYIRRHGPDNAAYYTLIDGRAETATAERRDAPNEMPINKAKRPPRFDGAGYHPLFGSEVMESAPQAVTPKSDVDGSTQGSQISGGPEPLQNVYTPSTRESQILGPSGKEGKRPRPQTLETRRRILVLCKAEFRTPEAIATELGLKLPNLRTTYLGPLVEAGLLEPKYPDVVNHPLQAYMATSKALTDDLREI
ncbi:putative DNA binding domain-containing protein [Deinococcus sp. 14RED07]|uniref:RNA-binding domain-containing protein n=1 Tax=Deinococcus sp. 14RED07 TaxID=2745874 RepID=UPI001E323FB3|nr:RNA-binding domain-containing protein [Deinococcus sp. 14RED07]MCD0175509.1 putative DNA binding domain-containing protein [Deinococcus sp. 14RED07]